MTGRALMRMSLVKMLLPAVMALNHRCRCRGLVVARGWGWLGNEGRAGLSSSNSVISERSSDSSSASTGDSYAIVTTGTAVRTKTAFTVGAIICAAVDTNTGSNCWCARSGGAGMSVGTWVGRRQMEDQVEEQAWQQLQR